jgi:RimJ/RimL family protein N-acetyltransferase
MTIVIRRADLSDIPWLLEQLRAFDRFFGSKHSLFPTATEANAVLTTLINEHVFFIAQQNANMVPYHRMGFIAGTLGSHPFNPAVRVLTELFWWVVPVHRGTAVGPRLLHEFEEFGRKHADWIVLTLEEKTIELNLVDPRSLERRGFRPKERSYLLEIPKVDA